MSTIATPRDPSMPLARRMNSSQVITTPTSSTRPSLDVPPSSTASSPNPNTSSQQLPTITTTTTTAPVPGAGPSKRANRAALREYYKLKNPPTPSVEVTNPLDGGPGGHHDTLVTTHSELDDPSFNPAAYISQTLAQSSLSELLRTYARVLGEIRALDAEKKALVYDNYSKLITATETIRRMQSTMDPLNPMAGTLDLVVARIYEQANGVREELRREVGPREQKDGRRARTRELAREVLEVPARLRRLIEEGKEEEARKEWEMPRRLLERWRERGLGGSEVEGLIEEGDTIVGGESESGSGSGSGSGSEGSMT